MQVMDYGVDDFQIQACMYQRRYDVVENAISCRYRESRGREIDLCLGDMSSIFERVTAG